MTVTLQVLQLAAAMRLGDGVTALTEPEAGIVTRLLAVSTRTVEAYAEDAPEDVQNEAVIRLSAWLYDADPSRAYRMAQDAFGLSGARALLAPWHPITTGAL